MKKLLSVFLLWLCCASATLSAHAQTVVATPTPDPSARISIGDVKMVEGSSDYRDLAFPVTLNKVLPFDVSVQYSTRDISAKAPGDYTVQTLGTLTLKAGQTSAKIIIRVTSDKTEEADETFRVFLARPSRVFIGDGDGIATILDDDYQGRISISDVQVPELNSGQRITRLEVSFSPPPLHNIAVGYETKDDSAQSALGDYIPAKGNLLFQSGRAALSIAVPIVGDTTVEGNERCFVLLSAPGYSIAKRMGTISILNDDLPAPPSGPGKIAFTSFKEGRTRISVVNADGSNETLLNPTATSPVPNGAYFDRSPSFSDDGSKIVFVSNRDGIGQRIYVMNADGTGATRLTEGFQDDFPAFSPDGRKIAFQADLGGDPQVSKSDIIVMNADGSGQTRITTTGAESHPTFAPDGARLAWASVTESVGAQKSIVLADINGANRQLSSSTDSNDPDFSPDGSKIVYGTVYDDKTFRNATYRWVIRVSTLPFSDNQTPTDGNYNDANPCFSPDGKRIAFESNRAASQQIFLVNVDGSGQTRLITTASATEPSWAPGTVPVPAPPGGGSRFSGKIAFSSAHNGVFVPNSQAGPNIHVMNADGTNQTQLTTTGTEYDPHFSPDGTKITWVSKREYYSEIYVMNADGSDQTKLTNTQSIFANNFDPSFSPDGQKILFMSDRDRAGTSYPPSEIYVMNVDGSNVTRLSFSEPTVQGYPYPTGDSPHFSPDGQKIIFRYFAFVGNDFVMRIGETSSTGYRLGSAPVKVLAQGANMDGHPFSPDGGRITWTSIGTENGSPDDIYAMNADGTGITRLTNGVRDGTNFFAAQTPTFAPDSGKIAFVLTTSTPFANSGQQIWTMNADGTDARQLTTYWNHANPTWGPGSVPKPTAAAPQSAPVSQPLAPSSQSS